MKREFNFKAFILREKWYLIFFIILIPGKLFAQEIDFTIDNQEGCAPLSNVIFTDISSGTVKTRDWDFGNGSVLKDAQDKVEVNYLNPGTYVVMLTATFDNGTVKTLTKDVIVHPAPVANFYSDDTSGCIPLTAGFHDLSTTPTGKITKWQWDFGFEESSEQNPIVVFPNVGRFNVNLIVTNEWGCESASEEKKQYIVTQTAPDVSFTYTGNDDCKIPQSVQFQNNTTGTGDYTYTWNFGDGTPVSHEVNPQHVYTANGNYMATLSVESKECQSVTYSSEIVIGKPIANIISDNSVCEGTPIELEGSSLSDSKDGQYIWHIDNNIFTGTTINYSFNKAGKNTVTLIISTNKGCADTVKKTIDVKAKPKADFSASYKGSCSPELTATFEIDPATYNNSLQYVWNFGDGEVSNEAPVAQHLYTGYGYFDVSLTVTDKSPGNGCSTTVLKQGLIENPEPVVSFSLPSMSCTPVEIGTTAEISNIKQNDIDLLIWDWNDGTIDTATTGNMNAGHLYTKSGLYSPTLTLVTKSGCRFTSRPQQLNVQEACNDIGNNYISGGPLIEKTCEDKYRVSFRDTFSIHTVIKWDFGDGTVVQSGTLNPITHTFPSTSTNFLVSETVRNNITGEITVYKKNVIIIDEKAAFKTSDTIVCRANGVTFETVGIDKTKMDQYIWDFGDNTLLKYIKVTPLISGTIIHVYEENGIYHPKLIITDNLQCSDTAQLTLQVYGPEPDFSADNLTSCDENQQVVFQNNTPPSPGNSIVKWEWNFGDNITLVTEKDTAVTVAYANTDAFNPRTVTLTATDKSGCTITNEKTEYIKGYHPKADFIAADSIQCGFPITEFTNLSEARNATYLWDFGEGTTSAQFSPVHQYSKNDSFTVKLMVRDENGCEATKIKEDYIKTVVSKADFIIGDTTQCAPATISFKDNSEYAKEWNWNFGDGGSSINTPTPAPHIFSKPGFYEIQLAIDGLNNCVDTIHKTIRVRGPRADWDAVSASSCLPYEFHAGISGSNYLNDFSWDFGDGSLTTGLRNQSEVGHTYTKAGIYRPNVILTSPGGCVYTLELEDPIIVDSLKLDFSIAKNIICSSDTLTINNLSQYPGFSSIKSIQWDLGDGTIVTNETDQVKHIYAPGNYTISLTATTEYGCTGTLVAPDRLVVNPNPTIELGPDITGPSGTKATIPTSTTGDIISYQWWPSTGLNCINCESPGFIIDQPITYHGIVTNNFGCTASDAINVNPICNEAAIFIPNAFTPNTDGLNDLFRVRGYGIKTVKSFKIYDRWGGVIYNGSNIDKDQGWNGNINGEPANSGVYYYIAVIECTGGDNIPLKGTVTLIR